MNTLSFQSLYFWQGYQWLPTVIGVYNLYPHSFSLRYLIF